MPLEAKQFDEDGDGLLSIEEISTLLAKYRMETGLSRSDQLSARRLIRTADINQDGKVTQDELLESSSFNPILATWSRSTTLTRMVKSP